jgi:quercetin dioxygenase-like cupin family protein
VPKAISEALVDDERAIVTKWILPSGTETGSHTHGLDYLVVYLTDGTLTVDANGQIIEAPVSKHSVTSRPAGISHNVSNRSGAAIEFIEIELKR